MLKFILLAALICGVIETVKLADSSSFVEPPDAPLIVEEVIRLVSPNETLAAYLFVATKNGLETTYVLVVDLRIFIIAQMLVLPRVNNVAPLGAAVARSIKFATMLLFVLLICMGVWLNPGDVW